MPISTIVDRNSDTLMVYFGSMPGKVEFFATYEELGYSIIYVLDTNKSWYSKGEFADQDAFVAELRAEIGKITHTRLIFAGISMGGYAALRFGSYIQPTRIIVFSPQVDLREGKVRKYAGNIDMKVLGTPDLVKFIGKRGKYRIPTDIHVGETEGIRGIGWADRVHANLFSKFSSVIVHVHPIHTHNIAAILKKTGLIAKIFE